MSVEMMQSSQAAALTISTQKAWINEDFGKRCLCFNISEIRSYLTGPGIEMHHKFAFLSKERSPANQNPPRRFLRLTHAFQDLG
jgi:hypothetical protein